MPGRLIVFEGVEGSGKSTQLRRSQQWLIESGWLAWLQSQGQISTLVTTREPGGTILGREIRQLLLSQPTSELLHDRAELLLFAADRAQHVEVFLQPHLATDALILCDRYTDSTIAYQGYGRGLDLALIGQLNQIATGGLHSDLTLWLDLEATTGLDRTRQRGTHDRIEQNDPSFHQRVQAGFAKLAEQSDRTIRIDASQPEDLVAQSIQTALEQALERWFGVRK